MKRYRFPLESVLRVRRAEEGLARAALAAAHRHVSDARLEVATRAEHYESISAAPLEGGTVAEVLSVRQRQELGAVALRQARHRLTSAEDQLAGARSGYMVAASRVSVLEPLDERKRAEHRIETERDEQAATDDLVVARHGRTPLR